MFETHRSSIQEYLKKVALLIIAVVLIFAGWQLYRAVNTPNLLLNGEFASDDLADWQIINQGGGQVATISGVLELKIDNGAEGGWIGAGQRVSVEPGQQYKLELAYRVVERNEELVNLVLRMTQFNRAGEMIDSQEISPAEHFSGNIEQVEHQFEHTFVADESAGAVEVGVGLFSNQATTVEIERIVFSEHPTVFDILTRPVILLGVLIIVVGIGVGLYRAFKSVLVGAKGATALKKRQIAIIGVNLALVFVFAEIAALGIYFVQNGALFYTHKTVINPIATAQSNQELTAKRIHPYLGYVDKPGWLRADDAFWESQDDALRGINNHGFGSIYDYPYQKTGANQIIIGIFGGSVAEQFAIFAGDKLVEALQHHDPFADKEIIVLNFAKAGYKQPQQLLALNYFMSIGQSFDIVLNIDGFNEVAFSHRNYQRDVDISMPHINILDGLITLSSQNTLTPEKLDSLAKIDGYKRRLNKLARWFNAMPLASVSFMLEQYYAIVFNQYEQELRRFDELGSDTGENSLIFIKPNESTMNDDRLFAEIANVWANSSVLMHRVLQNSGIAYIHILQPNQHYSNKVFTEEEIARALDHDQPYYSTLVGLGYPALLEKVPLLLESNVDFYNAVSLFDDEPRTIYRDNCCHYNQLGNEILAEFIADSIMGAESFKESRALSQ